MTMPIPVRAFQQPAREPGTSWRSVPASLPLHTVTQEQIDALDPLTYEVIRHRLWSVTDEMGEALKRMSGSPIVTDANDFDFAIGDELGQEVQVGLYNTMLVGAVDLAVYWTLRNRAVNPGIDEGDMFLCNDPGSAAGCTRTTSSCSSRSSTRASCSPGPAPSPTSPTWAAWARSFSLGATDVFSEALPTPPIKVVRDFQLQDDVADAWVRRSGCPCSSAGPAGEGRREHHRPAALLSVIEQYGADTVKAVMKRMMADAEHRLRDKLRRLPDGTWRASGYQDQSRTGDRNVHKITVAMSSRTTT